MNILKKIYNVWCRVEDIICGISFGIIVILTFINAVLRLFDHPITINSDIVLLLFGWTAFLGADVAMRNSRLVGMDILIQKFPQKAKKIFQLIVYIIILAMLCLFIKYGFLLALGNWTRTYNALPISYGWVTLALPVCSILMSITALIKIGLILIHFNDQNFDLKRDTADKPINEAAK